MLRNPRKRASTLSKPLGINRVVTEPIIKKRNGVFHCPECGNPAADMMHWVNMKVRFLLIVVCLVTTQISLGADTHAPDGWVEIKTPNAGSAGIFDPSAADDPNTNKIWLLHSIVEQLDKPVERAVSIGLSWRDRAGWQSVVNPANVKIINGTTRWQAEVGTLFHDPVSLTWKLLYHRYLHQQGKRRFEHGWIAYKEAKTPDQLSQAREHNWLTGKGYAGDEFSSMNARQFSALEDCIAFTEPGAIATDKAITVVLMCPSYRLFKGVQTRIVLMQCAQPCRFSNPDAWIAQNTAIDHRLAASLNHQGFSAPEILATENDSITLVVTPTSDEPFKDAYRGCSIYSIDSGDGPPRVGPKIALPGLIFHGACDLMPGGGLLLSRLVIGKTPQFQIFELPC